MSSDPSLEFLSGGGAMGELIRRYDWSRTPLGAPAQWPQGLRTALRILLTTQHPIFIFWGPENICFYNDAYSRSLGAEQHPSMLGMPGRSQWPLIWDLISPQIDQVMSGQGATWHENQRMKIERNGRVEDIWWTYSYGPIDEPSAPNHVGGVLVICTETTQSVLAEQRVDAERARFAQLFEQSPSFMAVLRGPEHVFEIANPAYLELVQHREILGKTLVEALPEAKQQGYVELLDMVFTTGKAFSASGATFTQQAGPDAPGTTRYLDFVYQPILDGGGTVVGIFVEGFDATDRVSAELALREADQRKDEFLAMLAHELRNPLAPIRSSIELLQRIPASDDPRAARAQDIIERQCARLAEIVDDLLDLSRIDSGNIQLKRDRVDVAQVIERAVARHASAIRDRRQQLQLDVPRERLRVLADADRLTQVVANLIGNASKFTQAAGTLRIAAAAQPDDCVEIVVADDGPGIEPALQPQLFDLFDRPAGNERKATQGLGTGLALVSRLTRLMGGSVGVRSDGAGKGSTFTLRLPLADAPASGTAAAGDQPASAERQPRLLVVDDNVDAADAIGTLLTLNGFTVETAHDPQSAMERAIASDPDVVLLDIGLPGMSGYELAREFSRHPVVSRAKLIALTGYGQPGDTEQAKAAGFAGYLVKPVDVDQLRERIESILAADVAPARR